MSVLQFPIDQGHGVQAGDPGAQPPPVSLEPAPVATKDDPLVQMIERLSADFHATLNSQLRFGQAFLCQLSASIAMMQMLQDSFRQLQPEDIRPGNILVRDLYQRAGELTTMLRPLVERSAAVN